jgi:hypothetical protein
MKKRTKEEVDEQRSRQTKEADQQRSRQIKEADKKKRQTNEEADEPRCKPTKCKRMKNWTKKESDKQRFSQYSILALISRRRLWLCLIFRRKVCFK